jgi:hypothetical protein
LPILNAYFDRTHLYTQQFSMRVLKAKKYKSLFKIKTYSKNTTVYSCITVRCSSLYSK